MEVNGSVINYLDTAFGPASHACVLKAFPSRGNWTEMFSDTLVSKGIPQAFQMKKNCILANYWLQDCSNPSLLPWTSPYPCTLTC